MVSKRDGGRMTGECGGGAAKYGQRTKITGVMVEWRAESGGLTIR